ncbi:hypothetical protein EIJ81_13395 [Aliivibrio salmonicida]|uniref:Polar flagellar protein FlaI n=1 Tax=Aliivibrio salmonicida (strain LFI1238) TaxID=316275 RepID=B6EJE4_ALISL|nr:hypothetical protein [Aliivibrio salmonicida]AZL85463.1 hypothetical protein EIJ81_13395 [Aliivibrio salmonicida]CAQ79998.1 polar flagellar protein FlaI [Aliivibrio salmonicida LFI1238]
MDLLAKLNELDQQLQQEYQAHDINFELLATFLSDREQLLHDCMQVSEIVNSTEWQTAIARTELIIKQMTTLSQKFALDYQKLNHAKKSVQLYRKFQ